MFTPESNTCSPRIDVQANDRLKLGQRHQLIVHVKFDVLFESSAVRLDHLLGSETKVE